MQGILFVAPSVVITAISYLLFALLKDITPPELRQLSLTIMTAVLLSLVGTAPVQLLIYRIVDEGVAAKNEIPAMRRAVRVGLIYGVVFTLAVAVLAYPVFRIVLGFLPEDYFFFVALFTMYSFIWVVTTTFWASGDYRYPAVIFIFGYAALFFLTYGFYELNPSGALTGYTTGVAVILLFDAAALVDKFGVKQVAQQPSVPSPVYLLLKRNVAAVFFQVFYVLAIFLDKVSVWVVQGLKSGGGLELTGSYTVGSFLGVITLFAVATIASFNARIIPVTRDLYKGTFDEIKSRVTEYRRLYRRGLAMLMFVSLLLFGLATAFTWFYVPDVDVLRIEVTIGAGSFFFLIIIFDSSVLPLFGRIRISAISLLIVCLSELIAAFFVPRDVWYAAAGFAAGSFLGFLVSQVTLTRLFRHFEYQLFRQLMMNLTG
jgi:uncharacterized membrane protein